MTALRNRAGPTRIWRTLKGKDVKSNDGKDLGEIKDISENYIHVEKGIIYKESFWIPKYLADAHDGKTLWLLMDEEELRGKYQYGKEPSLGISLQKTLKVSREHHTGKIETMQLIFMKISGSLKIIRMLGIYIWPSPSIIVLENSKRTHIRK